MNPVPDYVPMLQSGASATPKQGGCLVQIANWLADPTTWTDNPIHVHPVIAWWAIHVNDMVCTAGSDENRRALALLAPRLIGTGIGTICRERFREPELKQWMDEHPLPIRPAYQFQGFAFVRNQDMQPLIQWLSDLLDEFDRVKGRTPTPELRKERWDEVRELVGQ